jgi:hypothetical protein
MMALDSVDKGTLLPGGASGPAAMLIFAAKNFNAAWTPHKHINQILCF